MKIAVAGTGYVGLSLALLLAARHSVQAVDIVPDRVAMLNEGRSPLRDPEIAARLADKPAHLSFTLDAAQAFGAASMVFVATPTDFDPQTHLFDTASVEAVINEVRRLNPQALVVIKSTVPVGFTLQMRQRHGTQNLIFSPEFLREGRALHDNLHPSRIVVGDSSQRGRQVAEVLLEVAARKDVPVLLTGSNEAEAIKLFANTYLAMRVAFFNELDTYAVTQGLDTRQVIDGVCLDPRIGTHYRNPSFGYGGYCLPKDTQQLLANYEGVPQNLIRAVVESNSTRQDFVAADILERQPKVVGVYRLVMKADSDNFRASSVLGVVRRLLTRGVRVVIHEPLLHQDAYEGCQVVRDLQDFKQQAEVILANRLSDELLDVATKVYSRDLYGGDL